MDPRRFDEVARRLARLLSRRSVVGGSLGAWLLAGYAVGDDALARRRQARHRRQRRRRDERRNDDAHAPKERAVEQPRRRWARGVRAEACTRSGKKCGKGKKLKPCSKCCTGYNITTRSKKKKCACRPDGMTCTTPSQCCAGICFDRLCGAVS
ncbi:MAG: hypothetical protein K0S78_2345 [Thermomicrobiales bacterium]|nr:hypothetical protein [Thermomicrobiales bacterium]